MKVPLLFPCLSLASGVVLSEYGTASHDGISIGVTLIVLSLVLYLWLLRVAKKPSRALRYNRFHRIWICFLFVGIGMLRAGISEVPQPIGCKDAVIRGMVIDRTSTSSGDRIILNADPFFISEGKIAERQRLVVYSSPFSCRPGDIVKFKGKISPITDSPDRLPTGYPQKMKRKGITNSLIVNDYDQPEVTGHSGNLLTFSSELRDRLDIAVGHTSLRHDTKIFLKALLLGVREEMDNETRQTFSDAGVAHILALSGLHVGIIVGIVLWLCAPLGLFTSRYTRYVVAVLTVWIYAFIAGLSPTIVRAAVMVSCVAGGIILERKRSALNSLCAAVIILILADPMCVFDIGMQLSVACVASLILFAGQLNPVDHRKRPITYKVAAALIATLVATFAIWPLTSWYFGKIPLMFLPVNFIVLPLLPFFIGLSILYFILSSANINVSLFAKLIDESYAQFLRLASYAGEGSSTTSVNIGPATIIIWFAGLGLLAVGINFADKHKRLLRISGAWLMLLAIVSVPLFRTPLPSGLIVSSSASRIAIAGYTAGDETIHNLQRGENTLLKLGDKKVVVIDSEFSPKPFPKEWIRPDILIIGNYFIGSLDDLSAILSPEKIVLHSSILSKREAALLRDYTSSVPLHIIRTDGPYLDILESVP